LYDFNVRVAQKLVIDILEQLSPFNCDLDEPVLIFELALVIRRFHGG